MHEQEPPRRGTRAGKTALQQEQSVEAQGYRINILRRLLSANSHMQRFHRAPRVRPSLEHALDGLGRCGSRLVGFRARLLRCGLGAASTAQMGSGWTQRGEKQRPGRVLACPCSRASAPRGATGQRPRTLRDPQRPAALVAAPLSARTQAVQCR